MTIYFSCEDFGSDAVTAEGVIFDCDGLLVNSESVWLTMLTQWGAEHGLGKLDISTFTGLSAKDTAYRLYEGLRSKDAHTMAYEDILLDINTRYSSLLQGHLEPMPGALECVNAVAEHVPVAVASNGRVDDVRLMLDNLGIFSILSGLYTIDDVARGKPAPDLYSTAARGLGLSAEYCVAFEDSLAGARAASEAGLLVIGVSDSHDMNIVCDYRTDRLDLITIQGMPCPLKR